MHRGVLLTVALMIGGGGCLYTDPINRPPMITIVPPTTTILQGEDVTFTAIGGDPDSDAFTVAWVHETARRCPKTSAEYEDEGNWPVGERQTAAEYVVGSPDTNGPFCVWAFATDRLGALGVAMPYQAEPGKHPPEASIQVIEPADVTEYSLYADVRLSAEESISDPLATFAWSMTPPAGSAINDLDCAPLANPKLACFSPDLAGNYVVGLTVTNADGVTSTATQTVHVLPDQLPCIIMTTPDLTATTIVESSQAEMPRRFTVSQIADDGNPFPLPFAPSARLAAPEFLWSQDDRTTGKLEFIGNDQNYYVFPGSQFRLGDEIRVRVEVRDRNKVEINRILSACGDQPLCGSSTTCLQRITWTVKIQ